VAKTYRRENESAGIEFTRTGCNHSEADAEHADERDRRSGNAGSDRPELHADTGTQRFVECPIAERTGSESATK
jgi:hypothetical protein